MIITFEHIFEVYVTQYFMHYCIHCNVLYSMYDISNICKYDNFIMYKIRIMYTCDPLMRFPLYDIQYDNGIS
jgi:hypothetical protein